MNENAMQMNCMFDVQLIYLMVRLRFIEMKSLAISLFSVRAFFELLNVMFLKKMVLVVNTYTLITYLILRVNKILKLMAHSNTT